MESDKNTHEPIIIKIPDELDGNRLDFAIAASSESISRSRAQKLIEDGEVTVNGVQTVSKKLKVECNDLIGITMPPEVPLNVKSENIPIDIVYEDEDLLVVNKPRGMVVHPAAGNYTGTMVNALIYHCGNSLSGIGGIIRPGIVHRIDKDTSGLLAVAKNDNAHIHLSDQLKNHSMERRYEAIAYNNIKDDRGTVDAPIGRDSSNRMRYRVCENGKNAVTHYEVLERFGNYTHIGLKLETGRTHQIRVHMSYIGNPLLGDTIYSRARNSFGIEGQMLHAGTLGFIHPRTGEFLRFEKSPPSEFLDVLRRLRINK